MVAQTTFIAASIAERKLRSFLKKLLVSVLEVCLILAGFSRANILLQIVPFPLDQYVGE